jgi:hypothetical protein
VQEEGDSRRKQWINIWKDYGLQALNSETFRPG